MCIYLSGYGLGSSRIVHPLSHPTGAIWSDSQIVPHPDRQARKRIVSGFLPNFMDSGKPLAS
jgi:hypothetical protein